MIIMKCLAASAHAKVCTQHICHELDQVFCVSWEVVELVACQLPAAVDVCAWEGTV